MTQPQSLARTASRTADRPASTEPGITDETLLVRNYHARSVTLRITFLDADDAVAFRRTYRLGPGEVVSTPTRLRRGVYRVIAYCESPGVSGEVADCLIGSDPSETAVVETGNGVVSVSESPF